MGWKKKLGLASALGFGYCAGAITVYKCTTLTGLGEGEDLTWNFAGVGNTLDQHRSKLRSNWSLHTDPLSPHDEDLWRRGSRDSGLIAQWFVTTEEDLFNPGWDPAEPEKDIDIEALQTLTRLPRTRAILFSFKTHLYPHREIKAEGLGPRFADAIEGLKKGNALGMWGYKGADRWGKGVCEYLRS